MNYQLISTVTVGATVVFMTILIQVLFVSAAIGALTRLGTWLVTPPFFLRTVIALVTVVLWLLLGITLSTWLWAVVFLIVDVFQDLEPALYFSVVTFTTLGYGDITIDPPWRLLASFVAVNGLIIFGLNTAFLVEFTGRLRSHQESALTTKNSENGRSKT